MTRRALVTGGNRGIGFEIARGLRDAGLEVVIGARDAGEGQAAADDLGVMSVVLDVTNPDTIAAAVEGVTVLVNNAGVLWEGAIFEDPGRFEVTMGVSAEGPYRLMRAALPLMETERYGRVVNISSGWGSFSEGLGGGGAYAVGKAAMNALTVIADRDTPSFVKVNAMCPGWVRTRMGGPSATRAPEDAADTAIWLATLPETGPSGRFFRDRKEIAW
ncbi:MAG: SDR family NAD(P)-dependent oxidoreductase [Rhodobacteraceae bacterium]|nr:SDR family NAD(P)-dependent oxidoreductase [Paracoccaceae bacterium]